MYRYQMVLGQVKQLCIVIRLSECKESNYISLSDGLSAGQTIMYRYQIV